MPPASTGMKKAGINPAFFVSRTAVDLLGFDRLDVGLGTVNQFDQRHRGVVAIAEAVFQDAQVAAGAGLVARTQFAEQLDDDVAVAQTVERQAMVGQAGSLPRVISGSTKRRSSLAFGRVVLMTSCFSSDTLMLRNMARRWLVVRLSLRLD